ncbi:Sister chromatid cohesion protein SCC4-like protein [Drosera capensis]
MDSFVGVREKTAVLFAYGLMQMKQHNLQEARLSLLIQIFLSGHRYLTVLGRLALALRDTGQAREIPKSALTLAKKLFDLPNSDLELYHEVGEKENEIENSEYQRKEVDELQKRLADAQSSAHHFELIDKTRVEVQEMHDSVTKHSTISSSMMVNLDIPESVGLISPLPAPFSSRLLDLDSRRHVVEPFNSKATDFPSSSGVRAIYFLQVVELPEDVMSQIQQNSGVYVCRSAPHQPSNDSRIMLVWENGMIGLHHGDVFPWSSSQQAFDARVGAIYARLFDERTTRRPLIPTGSAFESYPAPPRHNDEWGCLSRCKMTIPN